jgi:hypothetical protein
MKRNIIKISILNGVVELLNSSESEELPHVRTLLLLIEYSIAVT